MKYVKLEENSVDVSGIFSLKCFQEWLATKKKPPKKPGEAFRKTITGHVRGDRGLEPFSPSIEKEIIKVLQERKVWPCFKGTGLKIGERGFQSIGYWERIDDERELLMNRKRRYSDCGLGIENYYHSLGLQQNAEVRKTKSLTEMQYSEHEETRPVVISDNDLLELLDLSEFV